MPSPLQLRYTHRFIAIAEQCRAAVRTPEVAELLDGLLEDKRAGSRADRLECNDRLGCRLQPRSRRTPPRWCRGRCGGGTAIRELAQRARPAPASVTGAGGHRCSLAGALGCDGNRLLSGRLLTTLALLEAELGAVNEALARTRAGGASTLCPLGRAGERARILHTVFEQRYAARVQGYLARR